MTSRLVWVLSFLVSGAMLVYASWAEYVWLSKSNTPANITGIAARFSSHLWWDIFHIGNSILIGLSVVLIYISLRRIRRP
jgi:hypothetical protein